MRVITRRILFSLTFLVAPCGVAWSQDGGQGRWILNTTPVTLQDVADLTPVSLTRSGIPRAIDLSPLMPRPIDQGESGSCVAQAVGYAGRGYYTAIERKMSVANPDDMPSAAFLHAHLVLTSTGGVHPSTETCLETGSNVYEAVKYLKASGLPSSRQVPMTSICTPDLATTRLSRNEYSIRDFQPVFVRDAKERPASDTVVYTIKQQLASGNPVMGAFAMVAATTDIKSGPSVMHRLKKGELYAGSTGQHFGRREGGHAVTVVGFDDDRSAFLFQNSWGTDWADSGFGWMTYEALKADLLHAFVMDAGVEVPRPTPAKWDGRGENLAEAGQCAVVRRNPSSADERFTGFVETEAELAALRQKHGAGAVGDVAVRPWPACEALQTLDDPLNQRSRPEIRMDSGKDKFTFGDVMSFSVKAPDFHSFLYLIYLQADGTVVNLVPRRGPLREQLAPGATLHFGDGKDGRQTFRASAPAGAEALIAIASRSPLAALEKLEDEKGGQYRLSAASRTAPGATVVVPVEDDEDDEEWDEFFEQKTNKVDDRLFLAKLREAFAEKPEAGMASRDIAAEVLHLTILEK
jgi:hypothetical protein